jgi:ectoine hydroxylase
MTPEQVLAIKPKVLMQAQREAYFEDGFLLVERAISEEWLRKLRAATDELVERSRTVTRSDPLFDLEPRHRPEAPRLRRVSNPVEQHPAF